MNSACLLVNTAIHATVCSRVFRVPGALSCHRGNRMRPAVRGHVCQCQNRAARYCYRSLRTVVYDEKNEEKKKLRRSPQRQNTHTNDRKYHFNNSKKPQENGTKRNESKTSPRICTGPCNPRITATLRPRRQQRSRRCCRRLSPLALRAVFALRAYRGGRTRVHAGGSMDHARRSLPPAAAVAVAVG